MASTFEHSCGISLSDSSKDVSCQKSSDVKFTISAVKRNVTSVSNNNILGIGSSGSDDESESAVNRIKRQRLTIFKNGDIESVHFHLSI